MNAKKFKQTHLCVVNPYKRKVYDFKKKRQVGKKPYATNVSNSEEQFPLIGYVCEVCNIFNNREKLFLVNSQVVHEECGLRIVNDLPPRTFEELTKGI